MFPRQYRLAYCPRSSPRHGAHSFFIALRILHTPLNASNTHVIVIIQSGTIIEFARAKYKNSRKMTILSLHLHEKTARRRSILSFLHFCMLLWPDLTTCCSHRRFYQDVIFGLCHYTNYISGRNQILPNQDNRKQGMVSF